MNMFRKVLFFVAVNLAQGSAFAAASTSSSAAAAVGQQGAAAKSAAASASRPAPTPTPAPCESFPDTKHGVASALAGSVGASSALSAPTSSASCSAASNAMSARARVLLSRNLLQQILFDPAINDDGFFTGVELTDLAHSRVCKAWNKLQPAAPSSLAGVIKQAHKFAKDESNRILLTGLEKNNPELARLFTEPVLDKNGKQVLTDEGPAVTTCTYLEALYPILDYIHQNGSFVQAHHIWKAIFASPRNLMSADKVPLRGKLGNTLVHVLHRLKQVASDKENAAMEIFYDTRIKRHEELTKGVDWSFGMDAFFKNLDITKCTSKEESALLLKQWRSEKSHHHTHGSANNKGLFVLERGPIKQVIDLYNLNKNPNCLHLLQVLLDAGCCGNERSGDGRTALIWAAALGYTTIAQALIKAGARLDLQNTVGRTALMCAALNGHFAVVDLLIKAGARLDLQNIVGETALLLAAYFGHTAVVQALIEAGVRLDLKDRNGWTALIEAAARGHTAVVQALIKAGARLDLQNTVGNTALMLAARRGHTAVVLALIEAGVDLDIKDNHGKTAFDPAAITCLKATLYWEKYWAKFERAIMSRIPSPVASLAAFKRAIMNRMPHPVASLAACAFFG